MKMLSTGEPSTLGNYLKMSIALFGENCGGVKFLRDKIEKSPNGENEEVLADEGQMIYLIYNTLPISSGQESDSSNTP